MENGHESELPKHNPNISSWFIIFYFRDIKRYNVFKEKQPCIGFSTETITLPSRAMSLRNRHIKFSTPKTVSYLLLHFNFLIFI